MLLLAILDGKLDSVPGIAETVASGGGEVPPRQEPSEVTTEHGASEAPHDNPAEVEDAAVEPPPPVEKGRRGQLETIERYFV